MNATGLPTDLNYWLKLETANKIPRSVTLVKSASFALSFHASNCAGYFIQVYCMSDLLSY